MSEPLGLSIGVANLVAARSGSVPVSRTPVVTLFENRPSEVGLPEENPNLTEPGLVLRGFVERVGDPAPLVAADGTKYLGQALTIEALEAMARTVGYGRPITVAVPAYWSDNQVAALRQELFAQPDLAAQGGTPTLISDATAALAAVNARPGFPRQGVVALCDFGAGGTSVTLANAGSGFQQIGSTVRYSEFSGDDLDQLILNHVLASSPSADSSDVSSTATSMGSVTRMLGACRTAKEQLSAATVATIATGTGGADQRLTRSEFEELVAPPLDRFLGSIPEVLQRNGVGQLAAVAIVGGGAAIPLISTRMSQRLQVQVFTTAQPLFAAAIGAATLGDAQVASAGAATGIGPAVGLPTSMIGAAVGPETLASPTAPVDTEAFPDSARQETDRALAWSEDSGTGMEPVPYTGPADYTGPVEPPPGPAAPDTRQDRYAAEPEVPLWYRRPAILLSLAGAAAAIIIAIVLAFTLRPTNAKPVVTTSQPPPFTTVVTGPDNSPTETVVTPPPVTVTTTPSTTTNPPSTSDATSSTSTTTSTTTTTTTQPTTTTTQPTTTQPTTTQQTTTQAPPTTTQKPPTTTAAPVTPTTAAAPTTAAPAPAPGG